MKDILLLSSMIFAKSDGQFVRVHDSGSKRREQASNHLKHIISSQWYSGRRSKPWKQDLQWDGKLNWWYGWKPLKYSSPNQDGQKLRVKFLGPQQAGWVGLGTGRSIRGTYLSIVEPNIIYMYKKSITAQQSAVSACIVAFHGDTSRFCSLTCAQAEEWNDLHAPFSRREDSINKLKNSWRKVRFV